MQCSEFPYFVTGPPHYMQFYPCSTQPDPQMFQPCNSNGRYPNFVGQGEISAVVLPDGSIKLCFQPVTPNCPNCMRNPTFGSWSPNGAWQMMTINSPQPGCQQIFPQPQPYGSTSYSQNSPMALPPSSGFQMKFHNDRCTSTEDIGYFCQRTPRQTARIYDPSPSPPATSAGLQVSQQPCHEAVSSAPCKKTSPCRADIRRIFNRCLDEFDSDMSVDESDLKSRKGRKRKKRDDDCECSSCSSYHARRKRRRRRSSSSSSRSIRRKCREAQKKQEREFKKYQKQRKEKERKRTRLQRKCEKEAIKRRKEALKHQAKLQKQEERQRAKEERQRANKEYQGLNEQIPCNVKFSCRPQVSVGSMTDTANSCSSDSCSSWTCSIISGISSIGSFLSSALSNTTTDTSTSCGDQILCDNKPDRTCSSYNPCANIQLESEPRCNHELSEKELKKLEEKYKRSERDFKRQLKKEKKRREKECLSHNPSENVPCDPRCDRQLSKKDLKKLNAQNKKSERDFKKKLKKEEKQREKARRKIERERKKLEKQEQKALKRANECCKRCKKKKSKLSIKRKSSSDTQLNCKPKRFENPCVIFGTPSPSREKIHCEERTDMQGSPINQTQRGCQSPLAPCKQNNNLGYPFEFDSNKWSTSAKLGPSCDLPSPFKKPLDINEKKCTYNSPCARSPQLSPKQSPKFDFNLSKGSSPSCCRFKSAWEELYVTDRKKLLNSSSTEACSTSSLLAKQKFENPLFIIDPSDDAEKATCPGCKVPLNQNYDDELQASCSKRTFTIDEPSVSCSRRTFTIDDPSFTNERRCPSLPPCQIRCQDPLPTHCCGGHCRQNNNVEWAKPKSCDEKLFKILSNISLKVADSVLDHIDRSTYCIGPSTEDKELSTHTDQGNSGIVSELCKMFGFGGERCEARDAT